MFASMSGNYEVSITGNNGGSGVPEPIGIFLNDAAGSAYENTPAVASGKLTVMTGPGSYETDIYETLREAGTALAVAWADALGDPLYVSDFGLLTTENTSSIVVGYVTKVPTAENPLLGFNTVI